MYHSWNFINKFCQENNCILSKPEEVSINSVLERYLLSLEFNKKEDFEIYILHENDGSREMKGRSFCVLKEVISSKGFSIELVLEEVHPLKALEKYKVSQFFYSRYYRIVNSPFTNLYLLNLLLCIISLFIGSYHTVILILFLNLTGVLDFIFTKRNGVRYIKENREFYRDNHFTVKRYLILFLFGKIW